MEHKRWFLSGIKDHHSVCPLLIHYSMATLPTSNWVTWLDLIITSAFSADIYHGFLYLTAHTSCSCILNTLIVEAGREPAGWAPGGRRPNRRGGRSTNGRGKWPTSGGCRRREERRGGWRVAWSGIWDYRHVSYWREWG